MFHGTALCEIDRDGNATIPAFRAEALEGPTAGTGCHFEIRKEQFRDLAAYRLGTRGGSDNALGVH